MSVGRSGVGFAGVFLLDVGVGQPNRQNVVMGFQWGLVSVRNHHETRCGSPVQSNYVFRSYCVVSENEKSAMEAPLAEQNLQ